ncbi:substrate-binding periplasmic protein [Marinobacter sp. MIT932201]|uniref:substrate-binding periplasmic protein n=1 Tax=Marinobacter sp. MIT932201 TaxID=3096995 RepID=UPI00399AF06A
MAILVAAIMLATAPVRANETEITVGVYHFPPIASVNSDGKVEGFLGELLEVLEQIHPDVSFHIIHTSPKRRHLDFDAGLYDVIFFQSPDWGWTKKDVDITHPILADEELYVALKKPGRDSSFFDDLHNRSIVAISGYYYGFAGYETDNSVLEQKFNIEFSDSHARNMNLIKVDRPSVAEVAIVSHSYLQRHLARHPEDRDKLLISNEPDQRYQLSIIARKGGAASADQMLELLAPLVDNGRYRQLVENWGLQLPAGFLTSFEAP